MPSEYNQMRVLRLFGVSTAQVTGILRKAAAAGCPGLRLLSRDGEFAVCVQAAALSAGGAQLVCDEWEQKLRGEFGDAVFGTGEITPAQACLNALLQTRKLVVASDERTGNMLNSAFQTLQYAESVYDFGNQSYANPAVIGRAQVPAAVLRRYPGNALQETACRTESVRKLTDADYAVAYTPETGSQPAFVLLASKRQVWACPVPSRISALACTNFLLDMMRRMALSLKLLPGTIGLRPGKDDASLGEPQLEDAFKKVPLADLPDLPDTREMPDLPEAQRQPRTPPSPVRRPTEHTQGLSRLDTIEMNIRAAADEEKTRGGAALPEPPEEEEPEEEEPGGAYIDAVRRIYGRADDRDEAESEAVKRHFEKERRAARRGRFLLVLLLILLVAAGIFVYRKLSDTSDQLPSYRGYGTAGFDKASADFLALSQAQDAQVDGFLAFPGQNGTLLYAQAGEVGNAVLARPEALAASDSHTVVEGNTALAALAELRGEDTLRANCGFTIYANDQIYRYKVVSVFAQDTAAEGENAFALSEYTALSNYLRYTEFVVGLKMRSLYEIPVTIGDSDSFVSLLVPTEDGGRLAVVGRLVRALEDNSLVPSAIAAAEDPLLPDSTEDAAEKRSRWMSWYRSRSLEEPEETEQADSADSTVDVEALDETTQQLLASSDKLLAGLTDLAGSADAVETEVSQGAEGVLPETTVTVDQVTATAAPTQAPAEAPTENTDGDTEGSPDADEAVPTPTQAPATNPTGGSSVEGQTINVTMNGTAQTLDLVECLAMIAQNELGYNQPIEAYKAQAVAAHCWVLSQGGYPSVAGITPTDSVRQAVREVANVLITYNGQVCFTPYFASASNGTASSKDTWGGERAWLQAVDSPYDAQYASNWNTNGGSSGSARFAKDTVAARIQEKLGIDLSGLDPSQWFTILSANQYGWVGQMQIGQGDNSTTCSGRYFRETLLARQSVDGRSLRSSCFTFTYDADLQCFLFDVYGYGHGCGMSQWGAVGYANAGWNYGDILRHYFTGTTLTTY